MSECALCDLMKDACKKIVKNDENRKICETLSQKLSNNEISVDEFFIELENRLRITDQEITDKAVEISEQEEK